MFELMRLRIDKKTFKRDKVLRKKESPNSVIGIFSYSFSF